MDSGSGTKNPLNGEEITLFTTKSSTGSRSLVASGETTFLSNTFTKLEGNSASFGTPFEHDFESSSTSANVLVKVSDVVFTVNNLSNIFFHGVWPNSFCLSSKRPIRCDQRI